MCITNISAKRRRKPGDLASLQRTLWAALLEIEDALGHHDVQVKIKAAHALATLSGCYIKALEAGEMKQQLDRIEAALDASSLRVVGSNRWAG